MISLDHVTKKYGHTVALQEVSLEAEKGKITGLLGRNGAGKTTALNLMTGYLPPTEGRVLVDGMDMLTQPRECKRRIGYLPERPPLYDEMTVRDYLKFVCDLREVLPRETERLPLEIEEEEYVMMGLRCSRGISSGVYRRRFSSLAPWHGDLELRVGIRGGAWERFTSLSGMAEGCRIRREGGDTWYAFSGTALSFLNTFLRHLT